MNLDDLPADVFTCARCAERISWEAFTPLALQRAKGDGDSRLVCEACRKAKTDRRRPISVEIKRKADTLRRAEVRAVALWNQLERERYGRRLSYWPTRATYSEQTLSRQLADANKAVAKHRDELAALQRARARGVDYRVAVSRRTSHYPAIPGGGELRQPC